VKLWGHTINKYVLGTIPPFFFKKMFGDMAVEITQSQRVLPQRLIDKGFEFLFPDAKSALADVAHQKKKIH
jgi:NAD dependent epimerase/dehydratase family enzyme